jgi:hypothetical protein
MGAAWIAATTTTDGGIFFPSILFMVSDNEMCQRLFSALISMDYFFE